MAGFELSTEGLEFPNVTRTRPIVGAVKYFVRAVGLHLAAGGFSQGGAQ